MRLKLLQLNRLLNSSPEVTPSEKLMRCVESQQDSGVEADQPALDLSDALLEDRI